MSQFEIEKKFLLSDEQQRALLKDAVFSGEKKLTDVYYDDADCSLTKKDWWLRQRNGAWELKIPAGSFVDAHRTTDRYREIEDAKEILAHLGLSDALELPQALEKAGVKPFCTAPTRRQKYSKGEFKIDIDEVTFAEFTYRLAEIELLVESEDQIEEASQRIIEFAKAHGLAVTYVRGKILEYLHKIRPDHFQALIDAGVVQKEQY